MLVIARWAGLVGVALVLWGAAPAPEAAVQEKERGDRLIANGDPAGAFEAYKNAVKLAPYYAPALNEYGFLLFKQGKQTEAVELFQRATSSDPSFPQAFFNLGFALRKMQRFPEAAQAYRRYTELKPEDPDGFYGLAEALKGAGDKPGALTAYESYLARESRPSEQKWIDKARTSIDQLKKEGVVAAPVAPRPAPQPVAQPTPQPAAQPTTQPVAQPTPHPAAQPTTQPVAQPTPQPTPAVRPQPTAPPPQAPPPSGTTIAKPDIAKQKVSQGDQLMAQRNYRDAALAYEDAIKAEPSNLVALYQAGLAYANLGYYQQAVDRWDQVAKIAPDPEWRKRASENSARARAKLAAAQPKPQPVAPAPPPRDPAGGAAAARQKYEEGVRAIYERRYGDAIAALNAATQHKVDFTEAYIARGSAQIGLRQYQGAVLDYDYALKLNGRLASPLFGLGEAYRALGRKAEAASFYRKYAESRSPDAQVDLQREAEQKARELSR